MAVTITADEIRSAFPDLVIGISDTVIECYISTVRKADACLDGSGASDSDQRCAKLFGVAYLIEIQIDGNVTSTRSANGDSITREKSGLRGIDQFSYGRSLQAIDTTGCVVNAIGDQGSTPAYIKAVCPTYKNRNPVYE